MDPLGFTCLIALDDVAEVLPSPVRRSFAFISPGSSMSISEVDVVPGTVQSLRAVVDNQIFGVALFEGPLPAREYAHASTQSIFWKDAGVELEGHKAFIAITAEEQQTSHGLARAQAIALTRLAAAVCEALPARGVFWHGANTLSAPQSVSRAADLIRREKWPVDIWIGWHVYGDDTQEPLMLGLHTRGAEAFLGFELDIPPFAVTDPKEPLRILHAAAGYLMQFGHVIRDGQMVEVIGERRTDFYLYPARDGRPAIGRLTVLEQITQ